MADNATNMLPETIAALKAAAERKTKRPRKCVCDHRPDLDPVAILNLISDMSGQIAWRDVMLQQQADEIVKLKGAKP